MLQLSARLSCLMFLWSQAVYSAASSQTVEVNKDLLAVHLSAAVFHGYAEHLEESAPTVSLQTSISRQRLCGYLRQDFDELPQFSDWTLIPFKGYLGYYITWSSSGYAQNEYFGMVGYDPKTNLVAISFRGTQPASEYFFNNFNAATKLPYSQKTRCSIRNLSCISGWHHLPFEGHLHAGYYSRILTSATSLYSAIEEVLTKTTEKPSLLITGHSLGGASACILAGIVVSPKMESDNPGMSDLLGLADRFSSIDLSVFGSPRVSNARYGEWLQSKGVAIKHFACETDCVPTFPPIKFGYEDIVAPITLQSYGIKSHQIVYAHDIRLYVKAMEDDFGVSAEDSFPLFRLKPDTPQIKSILFPQSVLEL